MSWTVDHETVFGGLGQNLLTLESIGGASTQMATLDMLGQGA